MSSWTVFSTWNSQVFSKLYRSKTFRYFWCCLQWVPFCAMDTPGKVLVTNKCLQGGSIFLLKHDEKHLFLISLILCTFCRWCWDGIPWLARAVDITEVSVQFTPAHLLFRESFLPKLFLLFFQLPQLLDCRLAVTHFLLQVLYCLVFALPQHFHRVSLSLHCALIQLLGSDSEWMGWLGEMGVI